MKEFDSIRIVDKGGDSLSFEMTGNVAGSPYDTIVFLLRATSGLIAASAKDSADPQKVADCRDFTFTWPEPDSCDCEFVVKGRGYDEIQTVSLNFSK